jgi:hypothetical protein
MSIQSSTQRYTSLFRPVRCVLSISLLFLALPVLAQDYPGLPTRSQNPLLQSYLIPTIPLNAHGGWSFAHNLYITNTYQEDSNNFENLIIDVENTRYDFQAAYQYNQWTLGLTLSLISNQKGQLDQTIEGWHDFFGLPQGGRNQVANNQINLLYQKNGLDIINSNQSSSGIGDIQLTAAYAVSPQQSLWVTLELPSSENSEFLSNQKTDAAIAYSSSHQISDQITGYGTLGLSLLADSGLLKNRLNQQIVFAQFGVIYAYSEQYHFLLQTDFHSSMVENSDLDAFDHSLQAQFGLRLPKAFDQYQLDIFFSEDILPGHAPDITFALRLASITF